MRRAAAGSVVVIALLAWWLWPEDEPQPAPGPRLSQPAADELKLSAGRAPSLAEDEPPGPPQMARRAPLDAGPATDGSVADEALAREAKEQFETVAKAQVAKYLEDNAREAAKQVDAYCKAAKQLAGKQEPAPRTRDAALFMAGRTDWEDGHIGLLHLPDTITQAMRTPPMAWRRAPPEIYAGLDFGWLKELLQFDHWSIATASPLRDVAEAKTAADAPLPNFVTLQSWSKLRLLKGLHERDLAQASLEVRHLADLCGSTGSLVGDMIRVAMLGIERGFFEDTASTPRPRSPRTTRTCCATRASRRKIFCCRASSPRCARRRSSACPTGAAR